MSEENKNPGMELNDPATENAPQLSDAALEGVSGGGNIDLVIEAKKRAREVCLVCTVEARCSHREKGLAEYLLSKGVDTIESVQTPPRCPYFNEARKA